MPNLGAGEWLIILLVIVILFGSAKLPTLARSLGKSMRILKAETKGLHGDDDDAQPAQASPAAQPAQNAQTEQKELHDRAARLRAEAARLEQEAKRDDGAPLNGVPVSDAERARRNN
ncbi:MAG TPA: Sec-independent protein translocase subunit TatA [Streptosporangiaceae bacterium]